MMRVSLSVEWYVKNDLAKMYIKFSIVFNHSYTHIHVYYGQYVKVLLYILCGKITISTAEQTHTQRV